MAEEYLPSCVVERIIVFINNFQYIVSAHAQHYTIILYGLFIAIHLVNTPGFYIKYLIINHKQQMRLF